MGRGTILAFELCSPSITLTLVPVLGMSLSVECATVEWWLTVATARLASWCTPPRRLDVTSNAFHARFDAYRAHERKRTFRHIEMNAQQNLSVTSSPSVRCILVCATNMHHPTFPVTLFAGNIARAFSIRAAALSLLSLHWLI